MLKNIYPPVVLPVLWLMDNVPTPIERAKLLLRFDHIYLIRLQIPFSKKQRLELAADLHRYETYKHQWYTGIATAESCSTIKKAWRFLRGTRHAEMTTSPRTKMPATLLIAVKNVLDELDPEAKIPRVGEDNTPWVFEGGPIPAVWTWDVFYAVAL
jgi:hypothetical protein